MKIKLFQTFDIWPVIELNPYDFSDNEFVRPKGSLLTNASQWDTYWKEHLNAGGITDINSIQQGYYHVRLAEISLKNLEIIVDAQLNGQNIAEEDEIISFTGGLSIMSPDSVLIAPQCCTAIYDFQNWINLLEQPSEDWIQIWIGHPWIYGRKQGDSIELTDYCELNDEDIQDNAGRYAFNRFDFRDKMDAAIGGILDFKNKVASVLKNKGMVDFDKIANILVFGIPDDK